LAKDALVVWHSRANVAYLLIVGVRVGRYHFAIHDQPDEDKNHANAGQAQPFCIGETAVNDSLRCAVE